MSKIKTVSNYSEVSSEINLDDANVFFSEEYFNYVRENGNDALYIYDAKQIICVVVFKKLCFRFAQIPSEGYAYGNSVCREERESFLEAVIYELDKKCISWVSTAATAFFDSYPERSMRIPFGSHVINLEMSEDELWSGIHTKHRNSIRRAEKAEVDVRIGRDDLIEDYLRIDSQTWERSGESSYGRAFFERIIRRLEGKVLVSIAYKNDEPQAGGVFFYNHCMSYYMYGASKDHPEPGSANLVQWKVIQYMKEAGVRRYSFVGCRINEDKDSKYHGIQRFKERFGGKLEQGYMWKVIIHRFSYDLFSFMYRIKNGSAQMDVIDQEIKKWGEINK